MKTQTFVAKNNGTTLVILENNRIRTCELDAKESWSVGRYDPMMPNTPDILFESPIVSREHGWIQNIDDMWFFVDNPKNLNGTFRNGRKISRPLSGIKQPTPLENGDVLRIDNEDLNHVSVNGVLMLFSTAPVKGTWTTLSLQKKTTVIGRDSTCDLVEPQPHISEKHAKITYVNGQYFLSDCNSLAGTFLNGKQIEGSVPLKVKDYISICDCHYFFLGDQLLYAKRDRKPEADARMPAQRPE